MSYQVIARKWRPQTFEEVTGQESITHTLRNAIEHDRLHHAYLFSGSRGVGKTTTARLLAKALNCHSSEKPVVIPCNNCHSCREIAEGRSIDVLEFDAASNTQVDKIRDLIIENINIAPARDRYKIFIIDEVHMLSASSFNALLKTVEEPPPNVVFIMATTELHKVPATILSRCQEFEFRTIPTTKIFDRLNLIAEAEGVEVTAEALREIARSGEGSMRDAQSNFDQVISFSDGKIDIEQVVTALGIASSEILTRTIEAIAHHKPLEALLVVEELIHRGQDLRNFCRDLLAFLRDLLVAKVSNSTNNLLDSAILDLESLRKYSEHFSESDLIRLFNSLAETDTLLRNAAQARYVLEIGLVKLMEMQRLTAVETILERLAKLEVTSPTAEKKTLIIENQKKLPKPSVKTQPVVKPKPLKVKPDFPLEEIPFPVKSRDLEPIERVAIAAKPIPDKSSAPFKSPFSYDDLPIRFAEISAEDLAHIEDSKLDAAFESRLLREGDDLKPIKNADAIISKLFDIKPKAAAVSTNGAATKTKASYQIEIPSFSIDTTEIPVLPASPTEDDLKTFALAHPKVRLAMKIFHGEVTKVSKT